MNNEKASNPKDMVGSSKLMMGLVPDTIVAETALAYMEGMLKYGRANWRIAGVRSSIYHDALRRHLAKWWNGENADPKTRVKHLSSIIACAGILLDAELCGELTDDRPPAAPIGDLIDEAEKTMAHLVEMFKDHNPRHYGIDDKPLSSYPLKKEITWQEYTDQKCKDYLNSNLPKSIPGVSMVPLVETKYSEIKIGDRVRLVLGEEAFCVDVDNESLEPGVYWGKVTRFNIDRESIRVRSHGGTWEVDVFPSVITVENHPELKCE